MSALRNAFPRAALALAALLLSGAAQAGTCTVTASPLAFGAYASPGGSAVNSSASVLVTCTPEYLLLVCRTHYSLSLSTGAHADASQRQMAAGSGRLAYGLFSDSARQVPWGDGGTSGATVSGSISTNLLGLGILCLQGSRAHTIQGRIAASQNVPAGSYSDSVVLTVTY